MKINSEYFSIILMINIIFILALAFSIITIQKT